MFVCTSAEWAPRASTKVLSYRVLRRVFAISTATFVLIASTACQKPKASDLLHNGVLVGRVIDQQALPIQGVAVSDLPKANALTDPQGAFALPLPVGAGRIHFAAVGFQPLDIPVVIVAGKTQYVTKDGYVRLTPVTP